MPHLVIEHSRALSLDINAKALMNKVFQIVADTGLFSPEAIKVRCLPYDTFRLEGQSQDFIHIELAILEGRSDDAKSHICDSLFATLKELFESEKVQLTVYLNDMKAPFYRK